MNTVFEHVTTDGNTYMLHVNQTLGFSKGREHSLLYYNQVRANGDIVDDVPILLDRIGKSSHSIIFYEDKVVLSLSTYGPISHLPIRYPTDKETNFSPRSP